MPWLRKGPPPHQTALAMIGAKAGQTVLVMGSADAGLAAEVAKVTGLNGRTVVADRGADAGRRVEAAAAAVGTLIEFEDTGVDTVPFEPDVFDVVAIVVDWVALDEADRHRTAAEACRVARPGGRVLMLIRAPRSGLLGRMRTPVVPAGAADDACERLTAAGSKAVRLLAEADGVAYVEGVKPRPTAT
jgi:ubiquinone/menaquinone biosynthesis C-methylase UbiE